MSRSLSPAGTASASGRVSGDAWLTLLRISGTIKDSGGGEATETYNIVNNLHSITSTLPGSATEFLPYGFNLVLADTETQTTPTAKVSIDNIDQLLIDMLRNIDSRAKVSVWVVLSSQPNVAEIHIGNMQLHNVQYSESVITGILSVDNHVTQKFPSRGGIYDPQQFPGLF